LALVIVSIAAAISLLLNSLLLSLLSAKAPLANETDSIEQVLDSYMQLMQARDAQSAYDLFSPFARQQISLSDIQGMLVGRSYSIFEGYQSLSVQSLNSGITMNSSDNMPQGTVANVMGIVTYDGGIQGNLSATLDKVDGTWHIVMIYVGVPSEKLPR
jgi:hypothetical protein